VTDDQTPPGIVAVPYHVRPWEAGQRLDQLLCDRLLGWNRPRVQALIRAGRVRDEHGPLKPSSRVRAGQRLEVLRDHTPEPAPPEVPVLHVDDDLLVVDKPPMIAIHPNGPHREATLTVILEERWTTDRGRPAPAHRIDRESSGVVVLGRHREASRLLKMAFAAREVDKEYLAIVEGHPPEDRFRIELAVRLGHPRIRVKMIVAADGQAATTDVEVERRFRADDGAKLALVRCWPRTGRQHQLRVHLSAVGHSIVGDKIYGPDESIFLELVEGDRRISPESLVRLRLPRQALHAARLELDHPSTGERLRFEAPMPVDMAGLLAASE